jgi:hypothetical protein
VTEHNYLLLVLITEFLPGSPEVLPIETANLGRKTAPYNLITLILRKKCAFLFRSTKTGRF